MKLHFSSSQSYELCQADLLAKTTLHIRPAYSTTQEKHCTWQLAIYNLPQSTVYTLCQHGLNLFQGSALGLRNTALDK